MGINFSVNTINVTPNITKQVAFTFSNIKGNDLIVYSSNSLDRKIPDVYFIIQSLFLTHSVKSSTKRRVRFSSFIILIYYFNPLNIDKVF